MNNLELRTATDALTYLISNGESLNSKGFHRLITHGKLNDAQIVNILIGTYGLLNKKKFTILAEPLTSLAERKIKAFKCLKVVLKEEKNLEEIFHSKLDEWNRYSGVDSKAIIDAEIIPYLLLTPLPKQFSIRLKCYERLDLKVSIDSIEAHEKKLQALSKRFFKIFSCAQAPIEERSFTLKEWLETEQLLLGSAIHMAGGSYMSWIDFIAFWGEEKQGNCKILADRFQNFLKIDLRERQKVNPSINFVFLTEDIPLSLGEDLHTFLINVSLRWFFMHLGLVIEDIIKFDPLRTHYENLTTAFIENEEFRKNVCYFAYVLKSKMLKSNFNPLNLQKLSQSLLRLLPDKENPLRSYLETCIDFAFCRYHLSIFRDEIHSFNLFTTLQLCTEDVRRKFMSSIPSTPTCLITGTQIQTSPSEGSKNLYEVIFCLQNLENTLSLTLAPDERLAKFQELMKLKNPLAFHELVLQMQGHGLLITLPLFECILKILSAKTMFHCDPYIHTFTEMHRLYAFSLNPERLLVWVRSLFKFDHPENFLKLLKFLSEECHIILKEEVANSIMLLVDKSVLHLDDLNWATLFETLSKLHQIPWGKTTFPSQRIKLIIEDPKINAQSIQAFSEFLQKLSPKDFFNFEEEEIFMNALSVWLKDGFTSDFENIVKNLCQEYTIKLNLNDWVNIINTPINLETLKLPYNHYVDLIKTFNKMQFFLTPLELITLTLDYINEQVNLDVPGDDTVKEEIIPEIGDDPVNITELSIRAQVSLLKEIQDFIGGSLPHNMIHYFLKCHSLTNLGTLIIKKLHIMRLEMTDRYASTFFLPCRFFTEMQRTFLLWKSPCFFAKEDPENDAHQASLQFICSMAVYVSNSQLYTDLIPVKIQGEHLYWRAKFANRSESQRNRFQPIIPFHRGFRGIYSSWNHSLKGFWRYTLQFMRELNYPETRSVVAHIEIPVKVLENDDALCNFMNLMVEEMSGEFFQEPPSTWKEPLPNCKEYDEFLSYLALFPTLEQLWNEYKPVSKTKEDLGVALLRFTKKIKLGFRNSICHLALGKTYEVEDVMKEISKGNVYLSENALTLIPPGNPQSTQAFYKVKLLEQEEAFNVIQDILKEREEKQASLVLHIVKTNGIQVNLPVHVKIVPRLKGDDPYYDVTMSVDSEGEPITFYAIYQPKLYGPPFRNLLLWQLLMLKREYYLKTFFPEF